jgi:hypothetical protein
MRLLALTSPDEQQTAEQTADETAHETDRLEVLADSAYAGGAMPAALAAGGHCAVIKPWPVKSMIEGGSTMADFVLDEQPGPSCVHGTVICPAGVVAPLTRARTAYFKTACDGCVLRERCTTSSEGRKVRVASTRPATCAPGTRPGPRLPGCLPPAAADGRTLHRLAHPRQPTRSLPRHHQERRLAAHPRRSALNLRRLLALGLHHEADTWALAQP